MLNRAATREEKSAREINGSEGVVRLGPTAQRRLVLMTTAPEALCYFLSEQIRLLAEQGCEVHSISSPGLCNVAGGRRLASTHHEISMRRTISPLNDLRSLCAIWKLLRRIQPDIVQTHTPKAGLLGMLAAFAARVPVRIYTVNGLPIRVQRFWAGQVLGMTERLACALATHIVCVSRSARRFVIGKRFCPASKSRVLGDGGSHGVNTERFTPDLYGYAERAALRRQFQIPEHAFVLAYVGRIVPAKGIAELARAWEVLRERHPDLRLLLCGYCEREHPLQAHWFEALERDPRVHFTRDRITDMPPVYAVMDLAILPTHCEGLPNFVLEASAMQVPVVASRVPGCVDAVRHGVTGLLVRPKDPVALAQAIEYLIEHPEVRLRMGAAARQYVVRRFSETRVSNAVLDLYERLLASVRKPDVARRGAVGNPADATIGSAGD